MSEIKLLPCPFCGGEGQLEEKSVCHGHGDFANESFVKCSNCGASGKKISSREIYFKCNREAEAISEWNTRKPMERIVERLESASHWTQQTFDDDGFGNDDSEEVISLQTAIDIVNGEI